MGSVCCCFGNSDNASSDSANNFCCLNFGFQDFLVQYEALFGGGETQVLNQSSGYQDVPLADSEDIITSQNNGGLRSPPAHLEIETRKSEKGSSHLQAGSVANADFELLRKLITRQNKRGVLGYGGDKAKDYIAPNHCLFLDVEPECPCPMQEDEDVCPTCLEEYTVENPKIVTKCSHHYHLSCIYEWQERSETCPVCGAVMEFEETS